MAKDTQPVELTGSSVKVDGATTPIIPQMEYNGATYDLRRNNTQGTLLASVARTATINTPTQTNYNARGVVIFLNITAASGTGGLKLLINITDPVSGAVTQVTLEGTNLITTGLRAYLLYPGIASGGYTGVSNSVLPRTWSAQVLHTDATSYTYSLGYSLIL